MLPIPPFTPELNPTNLVFNIITMTNNAQRARVIASPSLEFVQAVIQDDFDCMSTNNVRSLDINCG